MPLAQVIRFDARQAMGRSRRPPEKPTMGIILPFTRFRDPTATAAMPMFGGDEDMTAGRGRDPG
jgi:hypothetical protein